MYFRPPLASLNAQKTNPPGFRIRNETEEGHSGNDKRTCNEQLTDILPSLSDYSPFQGPSSCTHIVKAAGLGVDRVGALLLLNLEARDNPVEQPPEHNRHDKRDDRRRGRLEVQESCEFQLYGMQSAW